MRIYTIFLFLAVTSLCGHPDIPSHGATPSTAAQPNAVQLEKLRTYFDLFAQVINETITPLQQEMIDQCNALYSGIVPWMDGGDPALLISNSEALVIRLKSTLHGYPVLWSTNGAALSSTEPLPLTYGLSGYIWLEVTNTTEEEIALAAREPNAPPARLTTTIASGNSRILVLSVPPRSAGNEGPLKINLTSSSGSPVTRQLSIPVSMGESAIINGTILEDGTGEPFPGRVYVTGPDGIGRVGEAYKNNSTLSEKIIFEIISENDFATYRLPFFYSDGTFRVIVPAGPVEVSLERGYEHAIASQRIPLTPGETREMTLSSGRFIDMKELGWISGDTHIHWVKNWWSENEDIHLLAMVQRAEDLRVANNLTLFQYRPESAGGNFTAPSQFPMGPVASLSDDEYHIQMGEEYRNDGFYGHLCFLNIKELIQPISTGKGSGGPEGAYDWPLNKTAIEAVHAQGGISTEAHNMGPNHRSDVPVNAIMGLSDAFDQMEPEYYYRFLDSGLQIPLGNGSDHPARTIGSARMYVKVDGQFTYENWIDGIRAGRTFTSSGPLIFLSVNGREIGETLEVNSGDPLHVKATVVSRHPIGHFQIVSNGQVIAETETNKTEAALELTMPADAGRWFVARSSQNGNYSALSRPNIAHTSGIYVKVDGKGPFSHKAAEGWINLLKAHRENVKENGNFEHEWQRAQQLDYIEKGIEEYEALVAGALATEASVTVSGSDYYISAGTGSDSNSGLSANEAWATFNNLFGMTLPPGSAVYLKRGDTWANSKLVLNGKGTPEAPITLSAYGEGPPPVITGIDLLTEPCVVWNNPSHVRIDSLHCKDAKIGIYLRFTGGNTDGTGEMFNNQDVHITNCFFENMDEKWSDENGDINVVAPHELSWGAGIWLGGSIPSFEGPHPSESTLILNNFSVTHCGFQDVNTGVGNGFYFPSIYRSRFTDFRFEDSWVTGCENGAFALFFVDGGHAKRVDTWLGGDSFYSTGTTAGFIQSSRNFLIEDCQFAGNFRPATSNDGVGFDIEGDCESITVRDCVIHDNDGAGFLVLNSGGYNNDLVLENLTLWNNCRNSYPGSRKQNSELRYAGSPSPPNPSAYGQLTNTGVYTGTDVGVGDAAGYLTVYDFSTDWADDFSPVFMRTTVPWASVATRPVFWAFTSSTEGWGNTNDWSGLSVVDGALVGTSSGLDCYIESADTWVNTRERRWIRILMSSTSGEVGQVFFQTETEPFFSGEKSVAFNIIPDGQLREYRIDLSTIEAYRGVVTKWRVDPTFDMGAQIRIDEFSSEESPLLLSVTPVSSNRLDLKFNEAMLPGGGVFSTDAFFLSGLGQGTARTNPDSVSLLSTTGGAVYRLAWDSGSMNGLTALLQVYNVQNARGVSIWSDTAYHLTTIPMQEPDRDFDDMPDWWEDAYSLNADDPLDGDLDDDKDGISNLDEYKANTNPRDPASSLKITGLSFPGSNEVQFTWASSAGMVYELDTSTDLISWDRVPGDPIPSTGNETSTILSPLADRLFMRILAIRPNPLLGTP